MGTKKVLVVIVILSLLLLVGSVALGFYLESFEEEDLGEEVVSGGSSQGNINLVINNPGVNQNEG